MDDRDLELDDVVIFELPAFEGVEAFCERFRSRWAGWSHVDDHSWLFAARLRTAGGDLAALLRGAQELLSELGLAAVRYCVDGRFYVLEAAHDPDPRPALATGP
jgi:hypothetical protein